MPKKIQKLKFFKLEGPRSILLSGRCKNLSELGALLEYLEFNTNACWYGSSDKATEILHIFYGSFKGIAHVTVEFEGVPGSTRGVLYLNLNSRNFLDFSVIDVAEYDRLILYYTDKKSDCGSFIITKF